MKKILRLFPLLLLAACNSSETVTAVKGATDSTAATETESVALPYTVDHAPDWEWGSQANVAVAMNTLKAYVDNDMTTMGQYLADSVEFHADMVRFKGTRDSLVKFLTAHRAEEDSINIRMHDYESVKSKARGEEWVAMWYTETNKPKGGSMDSTMVMDDIKIVNGKVAIIDTKGRRLVKH